MQSQSENIKPCGFLQKCIEQRSWTYARSGIGDILLCASLPLFFFHAVSEGGFLFYCHVGYDDLQGLESTESNRTKRFRARSFWSVERATK